MTDTEIKRLYSICRNFARRKGFEHLSDDFAGYFFLQVVEHPKRRAPLKFMFVDFLRTTLGDSRTLKGQLRIERQTTSLDCPYGDGSLTYHDVIGARDQLEPERSLEDFSGLFRGRELKIFNLHFLKGMLQKDAGKELGIKASRVCQIIRTMKLKIKKSRHLDLDALNK